ncbi:helix-turn-helix domain-containing protein [Streptomyces sp. AA8]|uniref:Helix-turn-helix domain-containing protein n=2 Tax=Streptomyces telluris TaxID=2720021 RepID=A0A9X2LPL2_9ACTN|nr:helix-turn-helix domain-containing protein [Streptomyces telluris]NJP76697.1 helix-turn-helix domain-containing protein [Streptomyces telluris]
MPPRSSPTARQARLGAELRKLREASGLPARAAGELLGGNQAQISHIESGRWGVSAERVRRLATFYSAADTKLVDALCGMAEERGKGWWEAYRDVLPIGFLNIAELEHYARYLRAFQTLTVPGIFQTEDYARTIFGGRIPALPADELEARVEHRLRRRAIFERPAPPHFEVVIHEAALHVLYGGRKVARDQLRYLLEVSEWPTVVVRVIPFASEEFVGSAQTMLYAGGVVPQLDTVQLDSAYGAVFLDAEAQLINYRAMYGALQRVTLEVSESRDVISQIAKEL